MVSPQSRDTYVTKKWVILQMCSPAHPEERKTQGHTVLNSQVRLNISFCLMKGNHQSFILATEGMKERYIAHPEQHF
jgi:hypothetical protein